MLKRLEAFLIITMFVVITAIILIIYSKQREQEFKDHNTTTQQTIVNSAAYAVNMKLLEKQRHVQLFATEYARHLNRISTSPSDEKLIDNIQTRLKQRFQDFFTYTITNNNGVPKLQNIDSLIGNICQIDISKFANNLDSNNAKTRRNKVVLHPQPFNYHYDIMAPLYTSTNKPDIFFVSFHLDEIADILKTHELSKQSLILIRKSDPTLIEVTGQGARNKIKREIRLSKEEQAHVNVFKDVLGTDWRLIYLADLNAEKKYIKSLWKEAFIIISIVTIALLLLFIILSKVSRKQ